MSLILQPSGAASRSVVDALSASYGKLPSDYIEFLAKFDGLLPPPNALAGSDGSIGVRLFFPAAEIPRIATETEFFPTSLIPIADDQSGGVFGLCAKTGEVFIWDHETLIIKVAEYSFDEFLRKLEPFDTSSIKLDWSKVEKVWVDPNFKPKF